MEINRIDIAKVLPAECIAHIISFTSPRDACRSSLVSLSFNSVADSDAVWDRFLPSGHLELISSAAAPSVSRELLSMSKKKLYFHLCDNPILINNGTMSFALEKETGKKRYMIAARGLSIIWGSTPHYWTWESSPHSRFSEVARLRYVCWLEIKGRIEAKILSPRTTYAVYLVFKFDHSKRGFNERPVEMCVSLEGDESGSRCSAFLDPPGNEPQLSRERGDGWMEMVMGRFFNDNGDDGSVVCSLRETDDYTGKHGLVIEGIEFRPDD